jgi:hypothetical protein
MHRYESILILGFGTEKGASRPKSLIPAGLSPVLVFLLLSGLTVVLTNDLVGALQGCLSNEGACARSTCQNEPGLFHELALIFCKVNP